MSTILEILETLQLLLDRYPSDVKGAEIDVKTR